MSTIGIFGGSGFIGTSLCQRFKISNTPFLIFDKNTSVTFPDKSIYCDVRAPCLVDNSIKHYDVIINLAAEHRDDVCPVSLYDEVNVIGAQNICQFATASNTKKIIFTSSVAVYGFAPLGTNELGLISPFNDYGRTKWEAEKIYSNWQAEDPENRILVIVRPTVVFGERNRGNVYNLLKQIASGKFLMVGNGSNRKSMAYVENVAAFLEYSLSFNPGIHIYNYIDKPDFTMNQLVAHVNRLLGRSGVIKFKLPFYLGLLIGKLFDLVAKLTNKKFPISAIRVKKFCSNSVYDSAVDSTGFIPPVPLMEAIENTVCYEFIDNHNSKQVFYSE